MAHPWRSPETDHRVEATKPGQVKATRFVTWIGVVGVLGFGVTYVFDRDLVSTDFYAGKHSGAWLPISIVRGLLRKPPDQKQGKEN